LKNRQINFLLVADQTVVNFEGVVEDVKNLAPSDTIFIENTDVAMPDEALDGRTDVIMRASKPLD
jgi:hypothetical protein